MTALTGRFLALSGVDGSGKSTLAAGVAAALRADGLLVKQCKPLQRAAEVLRGMQSTFELEDSAEWRAEVEAQIARSVSWGLAMVAAEEIVPSIAAGWVVIADRWIPDVVVSQRLFGVTLDPAAPPFDRLPVPSLSVLLDVDAETSRRRIAERGAVEGSYQTEDFLSSFSAGLRSWDWPTAFVRLPGDRPVEWLRDRTVESLYAEG
jgi:dTMP kinase